MELFAARASSHARRDSTAKPCADPRAAALTTWRAAAAAVCLVHRARDRTTWAFFFRGSADDLVVSSRIGGFSTDGASLESVSRATREKAKTSEAWPFIGIGSACRATRREKVAPTPLCCHNLTFGSTAALSCARRVEFSSVARSEPRRRLILMPLCVCPLLPS